MKCPKCGSPSRVYGTQHRPEGTVRFRQCLSGKCGEKFKTLEKPAKLVAAYLHIRQ